MADVTRILSALEQGDPQAAEQLLPLVYDELRRLAALEPKVVCAGHERPLRGENLRETLEAAAEKY